MRVSWVVIVVAVALYISGTSGYSLNHCRSGYSQSICEFEGFSVTVAGVDAIQDYLNNFAALWSDQGYTADSVPAETAGATLIQVPFEAIPEGTVIEVTVVKAAVVYVIYEDSLKSGGFDDEDKMIADGWTFLTGQFVLWGGSKSMKLWKKAIEPGTLALPALATSETIMAIAVRRTGIPGNTVEGSVILPGTYFPTPHASISWVVYKCTCDNIPSCDYDDGLNQMSMVKDYYSFYAGPKLGSPITVPYNNDNSVPTSQKIAEMELEYQHNGASSQRDLVSKCLKGEASVFVDYV